ncbi:hypothetical protein MOF28_19955 [Bacillus haynesii]|uniref:hypothetical protein n=1 Tax=Bacillus haynesii TaxID=1925021 RepID=UPI002282269A|nr:hypothetical protein [Bacillus haynesii]MCY9340605.1 hypothetical protein [Bacillus haynesii]
MILININWGEVTGTISSILNSKFIITVLTSWPLAAVVIVFLLRKSFKTIIESRLSSLKLGPMEVFFNHIAKDFDKNIKEVNKHAEKQKTAKNQYIKDDKNEKSDGKKSKQNNAKIKPIKLDIHDYEEIYTLADSNPKKLLDMSWEMVKSQIRDVEIAYSESDFPNPDPNVINIVRELEDQKIISAELTRALTNLSYMYTLLQIQKEPNRGEVFSFYSRCEQAVAQLRKLTY